VDAVWRERPSSSRVSISLAHKNTVHRNNGMTCSLRRVAWRHCRCLAVNSVLRSQGFDGAVVLPDNKVRVVQGNKEARSDSRKSPVHDRRHASASARLNLAAL